MTTTDDALKALGATIKAARGSRDQTWVGDQVGVHQTTISKWEKGEVTPPLDKLSALERVLPGIESGQLVAMVYGTIPPPPPPSWERLSEALAEVAAMRSALDRLESSIRGAMRG